MRQIYLEKFDGTRVVIYDPTMLTERPVIGPKASFEIGEAGNVEFTLIPGHPLYDQIVPLFSYIYVFDDGEEIFYGRVLQRSAPTLTGQVSISCEGALAFLLDSEVPPDAKDSKGNPQTRKMTAEAFFRWCIEKHNAEVDDSRRQFEVGIVNANKKNQEDEYSITSWTQTKSAIESNVTGIYGGFLRVRPKPGGGHYIDWIQQYETENPQKIAIGVNLVDQTNQMDGDQIFTVIRPIGDNGLKLPEETLILYNPSDVTGYGRIVKTIEFKGATTEADLRSKANAYIESMHATLFINSSIKLVDMHYIDGTKPKIRLGDRFTNLEGLPRTEMTVASMQLDFEHVENDTLELKNAKSLTPDMTPEGNKHGTNKLSKSHGKASSNALKYYHEFQDEARIEVDKLGIYVKDLDIAVEGKFREVAGEFERISGEIDEGLEGVDRRLNDIDYEVETINGTAVIQNSDMISNIAGQFEVWTDSQGNKIVHLKDGAEIAVDDASGATITVGKALNSLSNDVDTIEGSALWTQRDNITGVVGEFDVVYTTDPETGKTTKTLVVNSGGGMNITKDGVEYGVYMTPETAYTEVTVYGGMNPYALGYYERIQKSDGSYAYVKTEDTTPKSGKKYYERNPNVNAVLTGGLIVQKINDETYTTINGQHITIGQSNALDVEVTATQLAKFGLVDKTTGKFTAGLVVDLLNDDTSAKLNAANVEISGGNHISLNDILYLNNDVAQFKKNVYFDGMVTIANKQGAGLNVSTVNFSGENSYTMTSPDVANMIAKASVSGNTLSLWKYADKDNAEPTLTFSKATTLDGAWSGGRYQVTASPQGNTQSTTLHSIVVDEELAPAGNMIRAYMKVHYATGNPNDPHADTGMTRQLISLSGTEVYNKGWKAAYDSVDGNYPTSESTANNYIQVPKPNSTVGDAAEYMNYYVAADNDYAYIRFASSTGTKVARTSNPAYGNGYNAGKPTSGTAGGRTSGVSALVHDFTIKKGDNTTVVLPIDVTDIYTTARSGYYTKAQYDANWTSGFNAGVPTGATLGSKVTGTVWNVSIARGSYAAVAKTIDLSSAYTDARSGYYTKAQYDANWTTGFNAGVPTGATLGTKVTGTVWNVSIARGSYAAVAKTIDLSSAYSDARSGYYTQAQYDAHYQEGWNAGWDAYYDDGADWIKNWSEGGNTYSVWTPKKTSSYDYYNSAYGRGKGNGGSATCMEWFRYSTGGGGGHNNAITFTRGSKVDPAGNVYNYTAAVSSNVTGNAATFDFYY